MKKKADPKEKIAVLGSVTAIILTLTIVLNILALSVFSGAIEYVLGGIDITKGDTSSLDLRYYKSGHDTDALVQAQEELRKR